MRASEAETGNAVGNSSRGDVVGRYLVGGVVYGYALTSQAFP